MNCYVRSGISILNDTTKDLKNLNELGIYLAKQTNVDALKSLKLIILASKANVMDKDFDINSVNSYTETFRKETHKKNETIFSNLSFNPQNFGLELMDYILHNYKVDLNVEPFDSGYTVVDFFVRSFARIEYDEDNFYKRYDMTDKKLDMVSYILDNDLLNDRQSELLMTAFNRCILNKHSYTSEQLLRMQKIINDLNFKNQVKNNIESLLTENKIITTVSKEELTKQILSSKKSYSDNKISPFAELENYEMQNDQCIYMLRTIPSLVKKKTIK